MTTLAAQPLPTAPARRSVTVVSCHRSQSFGGICAVGARMAGLRPPHTPWRPLLIGDELTPDRVAGSALGAAPGAEIVTWARGADPVRQVLAVRDALRAMGAAVVVPHDLPHAFIAAALDAERGTRCAAVVHADYAVAADVYRRGLPLADAWRAVSEGVGATVGGWDVATAGGTVTFGIDVPDAPMALATPLPPARPLRILFAGYLDGMNKRVTDLVELSDELHAAGVRFLLTVAGDGPARAGLERHLAAHIADGRATLLGAVPAHVMHELLEAHDVLVLVSRVEGWPLIVQEALAAGRPCAITSGCGGATRVVRDGVEGIVVQTGDMRVLAAKLGALAQAPGSLTRMSLCAHAAARDTLDVRVTMPGLEAFVEEALTRRHDSAASDPSRRAALLAERWDHILGALELIGPCDPAPLAAEWLADVHPPALALHRTADARGLAEALAPVASRIGSFVGAGSDAARWLGWEAREACELTPGTLVLTREPESLGGLPEGVHALPLRLPGLLTVSAEIFLRAVEGLRARGCSRLALYGAGRHTRRLGPAVERVPEVVAVVDDRAGMPDGPPARLWGLPVVSAREAASLEIDAVMISSDEHEDAMLAAAARWAGHLPVVPLYR